jgi:hypothetical protein
MNAPCREFRGHLERSLDAGGAQGARELEHLAWHEHLLSCGDCRALLESEEALEQLLATLPRPRLPRRLARRVLVRLRAAREVQAAGRDLDALLALDVGESAPAALARRVLEGLAASRGTTASAEDALDRVLEHARAVDVPAGLAPRLRLRLAAERARSHPSAPSRIRPLRRRALAAAAGLLVVAGAWGAWRWATRASASRSTAQSGLVARSPHAPNGSPDAPRPPRTIVEPGSVSAPDDELLAVIDVLEQWDVLMHDDVDVLLSTSLSTADQSLLEDVSSDALLPAGDDDAGQPGGANGPGPSKPAPRPSGDARKG